MRVNVYTEELDAEKPAFEVVTTSYVSSRTGESMTNYGIRVFLKSHPDLHFVRPRDDDRSAVTFWCGHDPNQVHRFAFEILDAVKDWHRKVGVGA